MPEKQKPRWRSITFLSVLLAVVLIGAFLWFTRSPGEPETASAPPAAQAETQKQAPEGTAPGEKQAEPPPAAGTDQAQAEAAATKEEKSLAAATPPAGAAKSPAEKLRTTGDESPPATNAPAASARQHFAAGNFRAAADAWRVEILATQTKFSILLEMDCVKESVRSAYRQVENKGDFFLLNKRSRDGRGCWLVLWGRYRTPDEATLSMKLVPEYFRKQSNPPSVIELAPYL